MHASNLSTQSLFQTFGVDLQADVEAACANIQEVKLWPATRDTLSSRLQAFWTDKWRSVPNPV